MRTKYARVLCYYILSDVPDAGVCPCYWLLLVSYSGMYVFLEARCACWCTSFSREKKRRVEKKGEAEFVRGRQVTCRGYAKKQTLRFTESIVSAVVVKRRGDKTRRMIISSYI